MRYSYVLLALAATPALSLSQIVPTRTLAKPDVEWSEPFSLITGIRELKSGRVIVADNRDKVIQLIDFNGEARKIGREGSGPGEFGLPSAVYAAPGDSTWVFDILNSRYLVIDPNGKATATFTTLDGDAGASQPIRSDARGGGRVGGGFGMGFAQGIDAQGRLYFRAPSIQFGNDGPSMSDTTPIIRWDRKTKLVDTVGVLVNPPSPPVTASAGGGNVGDVRVTMRVGNATPFGSSDTYVVTARGDVAVVRARDYHVDWIVNGRTVSGAPIKYDQVKITTNDRTAWMERRKNSTATMVVNDGSGRRAQSMPAASLDGLDAAQFPEFKGAFTNSVVAAPNGQVWVERNMPFDSPPTYDVIDNTGKLVSRVVLPKRTRLLGFGTGTIYLARTDEDDLQYIQRYRW